MEKMTMAMIRPSLDDIVVEMETIFKNAPETEVVVRMLDDDFELSFQADPITALQIVGVRVKHPED